MSVQRHTIPSLLRKCHPNRLDDDPAPLILATLREQIFRIYTLIHDINNIIFLHLKQIITVYNMKCNQEHYFIIKLTIVLFFSISCPLWVTFPSIHNSHTNLLKTSNDQIKSIFFNVL